MHGRPKSSHAQEAWPHLDDGHYGFRGLIINPIPGC